MDLRKQQDGFTIVEVLIAAFILLIGAGAVLKALSATAHNAQRGRETAVAYEIAQQEMEKVRALKFDQINLTSLPLASSDTKNPDNRVSGSTFNLNKTGTADFDNLVVDGGGLYGGGTIDCSITPFSPCISPGSVLSTPTSIGTVKIQIYRFVTWMDDPQCGTSCPGTQDYKRVTIAARIVRSGNTTYDRGYVEVQSDFIDPDKTTATIPKGGTGGVVSAQQFWLSDTACSAAAVTPRVAIAGDHLLHNTLGATCSLGLKTGTTAGSPDLLMTAPPPDPAPDDDANPLTYDYATDLEPTPNTDKGVQLSRQDASGCTFSQSGTTQLPQTKIHRWVTDKMTTAFSLSGKVTLSFYTQAINNVPHTGKICVYLYKRNETSGTDTQYVDPTFIDPNTAKPAAFFTFSNPSWPKDTFTLQKLTFTPKTLSGSTAVDPVAVAAGERLGLAISIERANTSADAIQILDDHPEYPTRLEVETTTPINAG